MSRVILCIGKRAEIPYCVPVTGMNIYSVEELCYFFAENAFLLDEGIVNKQLVDWLYEQCDLTELAQLLYPLCKNKEGVEAFVSVIVEYTGYFTDAEGEMVINAVHDCSGRSVGERKKTRADYYLENGKYELAIKEYELLLKEREECTQTAFEGSIYHGMGVAFAKMFLFEQADYYLEKAYEILTEEKIAFRMLAAKRLYKSEQEYICYVAEHPELFEVSQCLEERLSESEKMWLVSEKKKQIDDLKKCKDLGEAQLYYEEMERMTNRLKENFRRCLQE